MRSLISRLFRDESGVTSIEYGLIAALVAVAAIVALQNLGGALQDIFQYVADTLGTAQVPSPAPAPAPAPAP